LSVQFHPRDDRFFLAGSRDMKIRLWSIPDKGVAYWKQCPEIITAVAFTPDGKTAIAGTVNGVCLFYETEKLKYQSQMNVRSAHGKNAKGSKICSIQTMTVPPDKDGGEVKLLISSNDSRIRLYNLRDKSLEIKFKGHKSEERSIHATFSDDARYVVSGSEDKAAYIFSTCHSESDKPNQRPLEYFEASNTKTTWTLLAPTKTRQLLGQSEDPIYELCNPPPVTLLSRSESASSRPATESGSVQAPPPTSEPKKATESPAYLARATHSDGQIIITASNTGLMRVYRQDCASTKRKSSDNWDTSSAFSKKASSMYMARAISRSSPRGRTGRSDSTGTQPPQDRILSWRQAISSTQSLERTGLRQPSDAKSTRSSSPTKSGLSRRQDSTSIPNGESLSRMPSVTSDPNLARDKGKTIPRSMDETSPSWLQDGQKVMSLNPKEYGSQAFRPKDPNHLDAPTRPGLTAQISGVSMLSSEEASEDETTTEADSVAEVKCTRCGSTSFKARAVKGVGHRLVCQRCGTAAAV
jgi:ribosomal protein S27AE